MRERRKANYSKNNNSKRRHRLGVDGRVMNKEPEEEKKREKKEGEQRVFMLATEGARG